MIKQPSSELLMPSDVLAPSGTQTPTVKTADDVNDLFKTLDNEPPPDDDKILPKSKEKEDKTDKDDDKTKDDDDDIELKEPDEDEDIEKLDLTKDDDIEIGTPPKKKEILAKYPDIFKTFPFLEKMIYRDRQYNELFGSFDDAKELAERADTFNQFESQLLNGNTEEVLRSVKDSDAKAFDTIVDEYLPTLAKVDKEAYYHVVGNINKRLIMEMVQAANDENNEDLKQAALLVNQFVFGTAKFTAPSRRTEKVDDKKTSEAETERINYVRERFEEARDSLQSQVDNTLRATISDYIDPRGTMSPYVKKNAVNDALRYLGEALGADSSVSKNLNRLWKSAVEEHKFSKDSLGKIKSFYLSKAKANLKNAIMKARAEALKDSRPVNRDKDDDNDDSNRDDRPTRRITPGRASQPKPSKNEMKKGESVADFFARD